MFLDCGDTVLVSRHEEIGLINSLSYYDGSSVTAKSAAECMFIFENQIVGVEQTTLITLNDKVATLGSSSNGYTTVGPGDLSLELLIMRRKLVVNMRQFLT